MEAAMGNFAAMEAFGILKYFLICNIILLVYGLLNGAVNNPEYIASYDRMINDQ
jgi:hypothetical protein